MAQRTLERETTWLALTPALAPALWSVYTLIGDNADLWDASQAMEQV